MQARVIINPQQEKIENMKERIIEKRGMSKTATKMNSLGRRWGSTYGSGGTNFTDNI